MRTEIAIISALALVLSMPLVFAQVDSSNGTSATGTSATELEPFVFDTIQTFPYTKPNNLTDEGVGFYEVRNPDGTFTLTSHYPYFETESGELLPYRLNQNDSMIQVEVNGGKIVFDKNNGAMTLFNDDGIIVDSDSYVIRSALSGSDVWNNLPLNDEPLTFEVIEQGETLIIEISREDETGLFKMQHIVYGGKLKTTAFFTNYSLENTKIAFTETLNLPDNIITLNDQVIDLNQFVGQSFDRTTLEQNEDLVIQVKERFFNTGIGFDNLWQVNIHENNTVSLDYANTEHVIQIGETIGLDPTWSITGTINGSNVDFNISTLTNASVNSGDIDGTALTTSQITSLQSALNSGTTTWSQPYTAGAIWDTSNLTYSVASGYNTSSNPIRINTASSSGGSLLSVNSGNNGSIILSADQNRNGGSAAGTYIKDMTTNESFSILYPRSADTHTRSVGGNNSWSLAYHSNCNYNDPHKVVISGSAVTAYCGSTVARSGGVAVSSNFQAHIATWGSNDGYNYWDVTATGDFAASSPTLNVNYTLFPSIPTDVSATQNTTSNYNTVDLTWNEGTNGSQSTSYEVFRGGSSIGTVNPTTLNSDHSDDFSTDLWIDSSFTGVSGGVLTGNLNRGVTNHGTYFDLGTTLDNSQWVMRFQLDINSSATSTNNSVALYMSDSQVVGINSNKDGLGLGLRNDSPAFDFRLIAPDGTYSQYNPANLVNVSPNVGTYYVEVIRTSSTSADLNIYSDSSYSTLLDSVTNHTISSGIQNLQYAVVQGMNDGGSGGTWNISIDNLEIWDGVITPSSLDTNFTDSNAPDSSNLSYTVTGTNTVGTSAQSTAGLIETFYVPNQVVNVTNQGANTPLVLDWDIPTVPSVTNTVTTNYPDILGANADGTNSGTTTTGVSGIINDAWNLADTGKVDISIPMTSDHSIGMWLEFPLPSSAWTDHSFIMSTTNGHYLYSDGSNVVGYYSNGGNFYSSGYDLDNVASGWRYLVLTSDHTNTQTKIYIDGTQVGNTINSVKSNGVSMDSISNINQGIGKVDEVVIYNKALTASEISTLYNGGSGDSTPDSSGLLAHYDFEDTGNTLTNYPSMLGSSADGTNNGATTGQTGKTGNAWDFDGTSNRVDIPINSNMPSGTDVFTHNIWVNPDNFTGYNTFFSLGYGNFNQAFYVTNDGNANDGGVEVHRYGGVVVDSGSNAIPSNSWTMLTITYDGTTAKLFFDGVEVGSNTYTLSHTNNGLRFGVNSHNTEFFDGSLDEYTMHNRVLSSSEISALYNLGSGTSTPSTSGLLAHYNFEQTGNTLTNISQITSTVTTPSPSLSGYQIERDDGSGFNVIEANHNTNQYSDSTASGNIVYKISGLNAVGTGTASANHNALAGTPPDPPSGLTSSIQDVNTNPLNVVLNWSSPTNVGTGTLSGFEVYRNGSLITTTGLVTTYTDTVTAGTHSYYLKAVSNHGTSIASNTSNVTTPSVPISDSSVTLSIDNPNPSPLDVTVSFVAPSNNGGSVITGYNLSSSPDDITYTQVATNVTADQTVTVSSAGTWYFKSQAINNVGTAGLGSAVSITTPTVPSSPQNASSVIPSINSAPYDVTVSWDLPTSTGGSALTGYNVYRQTGTGAFSLITTTTALGYVDTVPSALNQDYTFKIHAVNNVGESTAFTTTTITTGDVPDAPVLSVTTGTTVLSWTVPSSDASITGYKVFRDGSLLTTVTTTTHSDFTPIVFGNSYDYKVVAVSSLGDGADSNTVTTTPETEITGMVALGVTGTGAVIDWEEPAYYQGQVTSYNVYYGNR